jgi:hypothetical protein
MRVATYTEAEYVRGIGSRGGGTSDYNQQPATMRELLKGTPGEPGNFEMVVITGTMEGIQRLNPRHRHNFDQIRMCLSGKVEWTPGNPTPPGSITYFPAGCYYGPYGRQEEEHLHIQFEGPNGEPFIDYDSLRAARDALARKGSFDMGLYSWVDENGKVHKQDGHEANAEYAAGKKVAYPRPRYSAPITFDPRAFEWERVQPGVRVKNLATLTEKDTRLSMIRLDRATYRLSVPEQRSVLFVTEGSGTAGGQAIEQRDGIVLEAGEEGVFETTTSLELLLLVFARLPARKAKAQARETAGVGRS